jgi:broad specificity phosphatase PhoE
MSTLTLVRHGQARPFERDSDLLSDPGRQQSRLLGQYWQRHGVRFDQVITGSLTRHLQTEEEVRASGFEMPEAVVDQGWNEYEAISIINILAPQLIREDPGFAARTAEYDEMAKGPDRNRYFQRMLEMLMDAWVAGRIGAEGVETFSEYQQRVVAALERLRGHGGSNRNVVVFTSGGPVGLCVQHALKAPTQAFLDINWRMRNASITEFTFSRDRLSLDTLNGLPHLDAERSLWTWR